MKYLVDDKIVKYDSKIGITNLLGDITQKSGSHKGGWTRLLKCQLHNAGFKDVTILKKDRLENYDVIIFDLGAEFSGGLNLFGGLDDKVTSRLKQIANSNCNFYSWKHELPDIKTLESRRENKSTHIEFKKTSSNFLDIVANRLSGCEVFEQVEPKKGLIIGDSHTPAMWNPGLEIRRQDGRTLFGAIKSGLLVDLIDEGYEHVMVQMSSIDIRHHIMRQERPHESLVKLILGMESHLRELNCHVTLCGTMHIESELRKLPKTGYYKGTPFYGTWEERNGLKNLFNEAILRIAKRNNWDAKMYPESFLNPEGQLSFDVMEKPKSVHISPEFYSWDLDNNKQRW
jgi:hypothetical protein